STVTNDPSTYRSASGVSFAECTFALLGGLVNADAANETIVCELLRCVADFCRTFLLRRTEPSNAEAGDTYTEIDAAYCVASLCVRDKQFPFSVRICGLHVTNLILFAADRRRYSAALRTVMDLCTPLSVRIAQLNAGTSSTQRDAAAFHEFFVAT